jgi:hypothetical protein
VESCPQGLLQMREPFSEVRGVPDRSKGLSGEPQAEQGSIAKRWLRRTGANVKGRIESRGVELVYPVARGRARWDRKVLLGLALGVDVAGLRGWWQHWSLILRQSNVK